MNSNNWVKIVRFARARYHNVLPQERQYEETLGNY
jgi:hypothetical protein